MNHSRRFDALIFDLDDTLLDTTNQLIEPASRESCQAMLDAGLDTDLESCQITRKRLFVDHPRQDVYQLLTDHFGVKVGATKESASEAGRRAFFHREVEPDIEVFEGVHDLLENLGKDHDLHLVTSGSPPTQQRKVSLLQLSGYFRSIRYVNSSEGETKEAAFRSILENHELAAHRVLCVGDRIDREIRAANVLGMTSCQVHYGEYEHLTPSESLEEPDYRIKHVSQVVDYLTHPPFHEEYGQS